MAGRVQWTMTTTSIPELEEERELADRIRAGRPDLRAASNEVLITLARAAAPLQRIMWGRGYVLASNQAAIGPGVISSLIGHADRSLVIRLIGHADGDVDSALPSFALWELSQARCSRPTPSCACGSRRPGRRTITAPAGCSTCPPNARGAGLFRPGR